MTEPQHTDNEHASARFLRLIDPQSTTFCFRTFSDTGNGKQAGVSITGSLDDAMGDLIKAQNNGHGVFVVINQGGQKANEIYKVRAVFADCDGCPIDPILQCSLPPHIITQTSAGKFHAYWLVRDLDTAQFRGVQKRIAARFGSDPVVNDLSRVMRLPGFSHLKGVPFVSEIWHESGAAPYTADQILGEFPPLADGAEASHLAAPVVDNKGVVTENRHAAIIKQTLILAAQVKAGAFTRDEALAVMRQRVAEGMFSREVPDSEIVRALDGAIGKNISDPVDYVLGSSENTMLDLIVDKQGAPKSCLANVKTYLRNHPLLRGRIYYSEFKFRTYADFDHGNTKREWTDRDTVNLTIWLQRQGGMHTITTSIVDQAVDSIAGDNSTNECHDWLRGLTWDGQPRLASLLSSGFGAASDDYTQAVGRCWLVSMVARALNPGCKVDTMPVFEGAQGRGKSQALQALVGADWFAESAEKPDNKDFFMGLTGKMLVEIGEMDSFNRADVNAIKRVMSCQVDRYRPPYGRASVDVPRQGVFAGTTNRTDWNKDETGARRFWPVSTGHIDLDWIAGNRDQLFAEAVALLDDGGKWWDLPEGQAQDEQESRRQADVWEDVIGEWLIGQTEVTSGTIMNKALEISTGFQTRADQMRVSSAMRVLGWEQQRRGRGAAKVRVWVRPYYPPS